MKYHVPFIVLATIAAYTSASAGTPVVKDIDWENACGGSNIRVTRVDGKLVAIDASVEHYSEARQWECHFQNGEIISALYRHSTVKRKQHRRGLSQLS